MPVANAPILWRDCNLGGRVWDVARVAADYIGDFWMV